MSTEHIIGRAGLHRLFWPVKVVGANLAPFTDILKHSRF